MLFGFAHDGFLQVYRLYGKTNGGYLEFTQPFYTELYDIEDVTLACV